MTEATRAHWDERYQADDTALSWFETKPRLSLELIREAAPDQAASIIDVGGGASRLVDALLEEGYSDLTVLDVSDAALARSKARLGTLSGRIQWILADITAWQPKRQWDLWHDRALFHFLTDENRQKAYLAALLRATRPGAHAIIAGFSLAGPQRCSGLPVARYGAESLAARLGDDFRLERHLEEIHVTPKGLAQRFLYCRFLRK